MTFSRYILTTSRLDLNATTAKELEHSYSSPGRYYHNWDHAISVCSWVGYVAEQTNILDEIDLRQMRLAALFHDVVYDVSSQENEELSAQFLLSKFPDAEDAARLIRATADHGNIDPSQHDLHFTTLLFLDCDMAFMYAESRFSVFNWLDQQVIEEYCRVYPRDKVLEGRLAFLKNLRKKGVFLSPFFRSQFEERALENLGKLIGLY